MNPGSVSDCPPSGRPLASRAQMSVLILSRELSIFVRVFLMRNAVNLADGFWYQHSFMSLAMEVRVWGGKWEKSDNGRGLTRACRLCECHLPGPKTICLVCLVSAGPHTQPSSCPQSWDHWGPRRGTAACSLLRCLRGGRLYFPVNFPH